MMTFFHTLYGQSLKTKTLVQISVKNMHICTPQTNRQWTPFIKIKRTFIVKDHWVHRIQFPLRQAAARSIHVSQSSTYPEIYVDLEALSTPPKPFWEHMHYVAFSRVTSIAGLYIESINEKKKSVSMKVSDYLKNALQNNKLQTNIQFTNKDTLNILLNNSRSFKKHFNAIQYNKLILQQHINIFLESKLCKHDKSIDYTIDDYMIVRADQKNNLTPTYGIISYLKNEIEIHKVQYMSTETIDTLYINIIFKSKTISIFSIYNSPKNSYLQIEKHLIQLLDKEIITSNNLIVLGDFNIQYNSSNNMKLCSKLSKYNLQQHVNKYTTINNTTIDFIFTNLQIQTINILYAHWSDHHVLQCQLNIKLENNEFIKYNHNYQINFFLMLSNKIHCYHTTLSCFTSYSPNILTLCIILCSFQINNYNTINMSLFHFHSTQSNSSA